MSEPISDADKIRNKRLAKLGSQNAPASGGEQSSSSSTAKSPPSESQNPQIAEPKPTPQENPFADLGLKAPDQSGRAPSINVKPSTTTPAKRDAQSVPRPRSQQTSRDSPEVWEDRTLGNLFRISLDPERTKDTHGNALLFVSDLRAELEQDGTSLRLSIANLEQAIVEGTSKQGSTKGLEYLLACWKRITRTSRTMKNSSSNNDPARQNVIQEAKRLCMSYCIFCVTIPDLLGQDASPTNALTPHLLVDPDSDRGLCHEFFQEAVSRFPEDDSVKTVLVEAVEQLSRDLSNLSMNDDYRPYILALISIVRYKPIVDALAQSDLFLPSEIEAQDIEKATLLGPFFRLSPLQGEVALNYFSSPRTRDRAYIANSQNALQLTLRQHQVNLFEIADRFVKAGSESRERMLDWFALTVNKNHKRRAIRTDPRYVSSDGFMVNVTVCLDRLCEPFMDATFSKVNRIEVEYLRRSPRVDIKEETKINADQSTSDEFYGNQVEGKNNFISEVFFLTAAAHHYGTEASEVKLGELRRELKHMEREVERFEGEREKFESSPQALALFDNRLKQVKQKLDEAQCVILATEGVLLDETSQARGMSFMRYVIVWIMRMVSGVDFPREPLELPLSAEQPDVFKCLPEYFIEDVVDHFKFVTNHMPQVISPTQCDELVMICITFLRCSEYIKNPGVKAGFVIILFHGVWPTRLSQNGVLGNLLNSMPFALKHLVHALMKFFIECESTGSHTQFYDKFSTRYEIFQVIKCIWGNVAYREQVDDEAKLNVDFFVRFVNLLLNDATYLLDESFSSFHKINSLTKELREGGSSMEESVKTQKEEALEEAKGRAKSYMGLTIENLSMLKLFTDALAEAFTMPEIVQRLADMLDYNLDTLVGPKQSNLRVDHPEEYRFDPASMLSDLVEVYLNLSAKPNFHLAVARDGRSYKPANFTQAANILARKARKSTEELQRWKKLCEAIAQAKVEDDAEEEDLGEIPDEFLDPLLATLMTDPVILPTSKNTVDRSTIRQMLLSDGLDPFNRAPLSMDDVQPDAELKARIDAFRAEKRGRKAGSGIGSSNEKMDTSEG